MHVSAPRPTYEKQDQEVRVTHDSTTPTLRINDMYTIEVEICLKRHVGARMRSEWTEVETRHPRRVAVGVRGASQEIGTWARWQWQHTSGYPMSEKKKKWLARVLRVQTLSQHRTIHGRERRKGRRGMKEDGWHRPTCIFVVRSITGSRRAPPQACVVVTVFESCTLTITN
jgi:hypothetical protein